MPSQMSQHPVNRSVDLQAAAVAARPPACPQPGEEAWPPVTVQPLRPALVVAVEVQIFLPCSFRMHGTRQREGRQDATHTRAHVCTGTKPGNKNIPTAKTSKTKRQSWKWEEEEEKLLPFRFVFSESRNPPHLSEYPGIFRSSTFLAFLENPCSCPSTLEELKADGKLFLCFLSLWCFPRSPLLFLTACLLYSRLVLNLHKFIRYKLLLPSYSFIAPLCPESSSSSALISVFLSAAFTTVASFHSIRARVPHDGPGSLSSSRPPPHHRRPHSAHGRVSFLITDMSPCLEPSCAPHILQSSTFLYFYRCILCVCGTVKGSVKKSWREKEEKEEKKTL